MSILFMQMHSQHQTKLAIFAHTHTLTYVYIRTYILLHMQTLTQARSRPCHNNRCTEGNPALFAGMLFNCGLYTYVHTYSCTCKHSHKHTHDHATTTGVLKVILPFSLTCCSTVVCGLFLVNLPCVVCRATTQSWGSWQRSLNWYNCLAANWWKAVTSSQSTTFAVT